MRDRFRGTTSITYLRTGERVADEARLRQLRAIDFGGLVICEFLDEDDSGDAALLRRSLEFADPIVASDGMPPMWTDTAGMDVTAWPLPPAAVTHPRTAGAFGRALRLWRGGGRALIDAVRRATILPAEVLQDAVPEMRRKGRVQPGSDADLVVFNEARVTDQATYGASTRPSSGVAHVIVGGIFVVHDGELLPDRASGEAGARLTPVTLEREIEVRSTAPPPATAQRLKSTNPATTAAKGYPNRGDEPGLPHHRLPVCGGNAFGCGHGGRANGIGLRHLPSVCELQCRCAGGGWSSGVVRRRKALLADAVVRALLVARRRRCGRRPMDADVEPRGVHLVGSVPLATSDAVFRTAFEVLGRRLRRIPDGETGARSNWIGWQFGLLSSNPQLELVEPTDEEGAYGPGPTFRLAPHVDPAVFEFGPLGYADAALASFADFVRLRRKRRAA